MDWIDSPASRWFPPLSQSPEQLLTLVRLIMPWLKPCSSPLSTWVLRPALKVGIQYLISRFCRSYLLPESVRRRWGTIFSDPPWQRAVLAFKRLKSEIYSKMTKIQPPNISVAYPLGNSWYFLLQFVFLLLPSNTPAPLASLISNPMSVFTLSSELKWHSQSPILSVLNLSKQRINNICPHATINFSQFCILKSLYLVFNSNTYCIFIILLLFTIQKHMLLKSIFIYLW